MTSGVTFFDDSVFGLSMECHDATMRLFDKPAHDGKPQYHTSGHVHRWSARNAMLGGFSGNLTLRHQALIVKALHQTGFRHLFIERAENVSRVSSPMFVPCLYPPFDDFLVCDLDKAVERANVRYPATYMRKK